MDTYFFDNPAKAIMKGSFLLVTYMGSILFKQFSIEVILPTILIYFLSNMSDYAELAFMKEDKIGKIRYWSLVIFLVMLFAAIITFVLFTTDNPKLQNIVNHYYGIFYILCFLVWFIPMFDGIRGQCDKIRISSVVIEKQFPSDSSYTIMSQATTNIEENSLEQNFTVNKSDNKIEDTSPNG